MIKTIDTGRKYRSAADCGAWVGSGVAEGASTMFNAVSAYEL